MISGILHGAPIWVWPVLMSLVFMGWRATRERMKPVWPIYVMPFAGVLSINAVHGLGVGGLSWMVFVMAYLVGTRWGKRFQKGIILERSDGQVRLAGEWVTLTVLMVIFWMNFAGGVAHAISPETYHATWFHVVFAAVAATAAGSFFGRALQVYRS